MRSSFHLVMLLFVTSLLNGQTVIKTYYDILKTQIQEEYQVNASGEKHGWYKGYASNGVVKEKAVFNRGKLNGLYQFYDVTSGRAILQEEITYKEGVKNGPYKLYSMDEFHVVEEQGNYLNDLKEGVWVSIKLIDKDYPTGYTHSKMTFTLHEGNIVQADSKSYYYNSGKLYRESTERNGRTVVLEFDEFGNRIVEQFLSDKGMTDSSKAYYSNGNVRAEYFFGYINNKKVEKDYRYNKDGTVLRKSKKVDDILTEFEAYNQDGSKTQEYIKWQEGNSAYLEKQKAELEEKQKAAIKKSQERIKTFDESIQKANEYYNKQEFDKAKLEYASAKRMNQNIGNKDTTFLRYYSQRIEQLNSKIQSVDSLTYGNIEEFNRVKTDVDSQNSEIDSRRSLVNTNKILAENNKEGSTAVIYEKGKLAFDYLAENRKRQRDFKLKLKEGDVLLNFLTNWNAWVSKPSKALNKKLEVLTEPQDIINIIQSFK